MSAWKNIKKASIGWIKGYAQKVGGVTNSSDSGHFTPQNSSYWIFVGLFFLCFAANRFFFSTASKTEYLGSLTKQIKKPIAKELREDLVYQKLSDLLDDLENFEQLDQLRPFLPLRPEILDSVPSTVPLFREHYVLSSSYGNRRHPVHRVTKKHFGVDLAAEKDTPIYCTAAGRVAHIENNPNGHGVHVIISHAYGFSTLYGHMESVVVTKGEALDAHDFIGTVGSTGISTGPHLHYEVIKDGQRVDPAPSFNLKYEVYSNLKSD
ncbi:M23 family metallopeptidase [Pricia sp. S334]|jgi:murein DD-endopeptidase MepM/ murein hydrolase activator NlpD|uniref:M23 family metallopeptidase n=1 Tax=Pricia mediterranea TaxID=3076079 RepID=A0ABU3L1L5_9FLAO|nr:M23 family metallopeptidase [Pricia sp. S334]MDT7827206.1 M23 family metallopeptidase [Pricia sp. S334]